MNHNMLTKGELLAFARLKKMSRDMKTRDDHAALKAAVGVWIDEGKTPTARRRRGDWSFRISGAYTDLDAPDPRYPPRTVWGYNEGD